LSSYAIPEEAGNVSRKTDADGQVVVDLLIADNEGLEFIEVKAQDLQVVGK
jgi:hypothetical protein